MSTAMATDLPIDVLHPAPPVIELRDVILEQLHADCTCEVCYRNTATAIAERIVEAFAVTRRVTAIETMTKDGAFSCRCAGPNNGKLTGCCGVGGDDGLCQWCRERCPRAPEAGS